MKNFKFIPYDKNLVSRARELRKKMTETEKFFWNEVLKNEKLSGFKFTRQKPIGHFIMDFYCAKFKLAVEIDGEIHNFQKIRDKERDNFLRQKFGLKILRYTDKEIFNKPGEVVKNLAGVMEKIKIPLTRGI